MEKNRIQTVFLSFIFPIFEKNVQYSTVIDGVKYPKFVPLHLNTSIDFDCLNSNNESKIIN